MSDENTRSDRYLKFPETMTLPGWRFQQEHERILGFIVYVIQLATSHDEKSQFAARVLYKSEDSEKYREMLQKIKKHGAIRDLRELHRTLLLEMMLCRAADNFLTYVTEFLAVVFCTRPETLRSSETVRLDAVLKHATMPDLVRDLAERRVNQLSYQGMRDLSAYLADRLGFELFPNPDSLERAVRIIETRNLTVHNRGLVNALFIYRVPGTSAKVGDPVDLDTKQIFDDQEFIARSVYDVDARGVDKFNLSAGPRTIPEET